MAKNISLICGLLAILAVATLLLDHNIKPDTKSVPDITSRDVPLHSAPDFSFTDLNGHTSDLSAFRGKIVILHFWATWCPPCLVEFPKLVEAAKGKENILAVLAVSSDDEKSVLRRYAMRKTLPKNVHVIWDEGRRITHDLFQTFSYPETIIIGADGKMLRKIAGDADWTGDVMKTYLDEITAGLADKAGKP